MVSYENGSIKAYAENAEKIEFYVDDKLIATLKQPPYEIKVYLKGKHEIKAIAYHGNAKTWDEKVVES